MSESWGVGREGEPRQAATSQGERENTPSAVFKTQLVVEGEETGCPRKIPWRLAWRSTRGLC